MKNQLCLFTAFMMSFAVASAVSGAPLALHTGDNDPVTGDATAWVIDSSGPAVTAGAVADTEPAWEIADTGVGRLFYSFDVTTDVSAGWVLEGRVKVMPVGLSDPNSTTRQIDFWHDAGGSGDQLFSIRLGYDGSGNATAILRGENSTVYSVGNSGYNDYKLVATPDGLGGFTTDFFINDVLQKSGYLGDTPGTSVSFLRWGNPSSTGNSTITGTARYSLVSFTVIPEPASLLLMGLGGGLFVLRPRRSVGLTDAPMNDVS